MTSVAPTLPLESYPARRPRGAPRPPRGSGPRTLLVVLAAVAGGLVAGLAILAALVFASGQLVRVPPPDTSGNLDPLVTAAGLQESSRDGTDGDSLFGHPASLTVTATRSPSTGGPVCVALYRAAADRGWTSQSGVTTATCSEPGSSPSDPLRDHRFDTLVAPDGQAVGVSWDVAGPGVDEVSFSLESDPGAA